MSIKTILLFCLAFNLLLSQDPNNFKLILHEKRQFGGACLDGSPPGMYIHQGTGPNKDKFIMYFQGGGFCGQPGLAQTLEDCYQTSKGKLGSTTVYPPQRSYKGQGLLSPFKQENSLFYDWTKIDIIYCDGSEYQGTRNQTVPYKDAKLHFRGKNNMLQQFGYLNKTYDFFNKDTIVISGSSAGGIATFFWANYLYDNTKTSKVFMMPDSGVFITDYYTPITNRVPIRQLATEVMKLANAAEHFTIPQCIKQFDGDIIECFNSANSAKYFKPPMFMVQSPYDQWSIDNILELKCKSGSAPYSIQNCNLTERNLIQDLRRKTIDAFYKIKGNRTDVGIWGAACVKHGFIKGVQFNSTKYRVPTTTGITAAEAIRQFLNDPYNAKWHLDMSQWPQNTGCSGLNLQRTSFNE